MSLSKYQLLIGFQVGRMIAHKWPQSGKQGHGHEHPIPNVSRDKLVMFMHAMPCCPHSIHLVTNYTGNDLSSLKLPSSHSPLVDRAYT